MGRLGRVTNPDPTKPGKAKKTGGTPRIGREGGLLGEKGPGNNKSTGSTPQVGKSTQKVGLLR